MNHHISPENEYKMMLDFFQTGGTVDNMPEPLLRARRIWKRVDELIRKTPWYDNEKIANQLIADFPEYDLKLSTAKNHVTAAKKYFDFVETDSPATHRRILTDLLYKQINKLLEYQPYNPVGTSKQIEALANRIASINHLYEKDKEETTQTNDIFIVLSENDFDFPDVKQITDKELYSIVEEVTTVVDLTDEQKQKLIDKDVTGKII